MLVGRLVDGELVEGVGAQRGKGILSVRDKKNGGWSNPAFLTITGGSFGAQIGRAEEIFTTPLNPYTKALLASNPTVGSFA